MNYALVRDGAVKRVGLPSTGTLSDGSVVANYDKLPEDVLKSEGWVSTEDPGPPAYNAETHHVVSNWTVSSGKVVRSYSVVELPPLPEPVPDPIEERFREIEARLDRASTVPVTGEAAKVRDSLKPI